MFGILNILLRVSCHTNEFKRGDMDLKDYLDSRNISIKEFSDMIKVSANAVSNYLHKRRAPTLKIALKIQEVTKNRVTFQDLLTGWKGRKNG